MSSRLKLSALTTSCAAKEEMKQRVVYSDSHIGTRSACLPVYGVVLRIKIFLQIISGLWSLSLSARVRELLNSWIALPLAAFNRQPDC